MTDAEEVARLADLGYEIPEPLSFEYGRPLTTLVSLVELLRFMGYTEHAEEIESDDEWGAFQDLIERAEEYLNDAAPPGYKFAKVGGIYQYRKVE